MAVELKGVATTLFRIIIGYVVACLGASLVMFLAVAVMEWGSPPVAGRTYLGDLANQLGWLPITAIMMAVAAAPVALLTVIISEFFKIEKLWFFLLAGALAVIPIIMTTGGKTNFERLEGIATLAPFGAIAGACFWLVRHRKWPI